MIKTSKIAGLLLVFILSTMLAGAALETSDVKLGSASQERGTNTTTSITVKNTGANTVTGLALSFSGVSSKYDISYGMSGSSIAPNDSITITFEGYVPLDLDAVDSKGRKIAVDIGDVVIRGTEQGAAVSKSVNLLMEAENSLEFSRDSELVVAGDSTSLRNDKTYNDVTRGDKVDLNIVIQNTFSDNGDCEDDGTNCDIEDIEYSIESRDDDLDVSEDLGFGSLSADDEDSDTVSFTVPDDLTKGSYLLDMWMTGTDENGALHGDRWTFTLKIDVPRDQVTITSLELDPETLDCNDERQVTLTVNLKNTGSDDETRTVIDVVSSKLKILKSVSNLDIESGDKLTKTFNLDIPKGAAAGSYAIEAIVTADDKEESDRDVATLTINACSKPPVNNSTGSNNGNSGNNGNNAGNTSSTDVNIIQVPPTAGVIYGKPKDTGVDTATIMLIVGVFVLALLLLLILVVLLTRR